MSVPITRVMFFMCHIDGDLMGEMIAAALLSVVPLCESPSTWALHFYLKKNGNQADTGINVRYT